MVKTSHLQATQTFSVKKLLKNTAMLKAKQNLKSNFNQRLIFSKRPITGYLSNYSLLQYTVIKKLEDFFMSQPIVPLTVPKSRRFEKKSRNEILMKIRLEKVELTFFHSINQEVLETILDKVLFYDNPAQ